MKDFILVIHHSLLLTCFLTAGIINGYDSRTSNFSCHEKLVKMFQPASKIFSDCNTANDSVFSVATNFEGGSAEVLALDPETQYVRIRPAGDPIRGMPNWWYLRLDNVNVNKPVLLEVVQKDAELLSNASGKMHRISPAWTWPDRAAFSADGETWTHTAVGERQEKQMLYRIAPKSKTIWIAWGPPFTPANASGFVEQAARKYSYVKSFILSQTREGRSVPALKISEGNKLATVRPAIWVHARQHAWEVGSSWVATGFAAWVLGESEDAKWLRQNTEVYLVPIMDIDHVATGDGGKHAVPQDHNRDWSDTPHWPEVAATQQHILALVKEGRMSILLDLHNPGPGSTVEAFYIVNKDYIGALAEPRQLRFMALAREQFGEVKQHDAKPPAQNPSAFYRVCDGWTATHGNPHTIAVCVETPWNTLSSTTVGYKEVGERLAKIVHTLIREDLR